MTPAPDLDQERTAGLERLFAQHGYQDYKWIDPDRIVVAQWVRMKCMYGCPNYGNKASCPPNVPSIPECERFFGEYRRIAVFHLQKAFDPPEERFAWYKKETVRFAGLERAVFLAGFEKAFSLLFGGCNLCAECGAERAACKQPALSRPAPEALGMDVYATVRGIGYPIQVRTEKTQAMDRYLFLLVD